MGTLVSWAKKDQIPQFAWLLVIYKNKYLFFREKIDMWSDFGEEELLHKFLLIVDSLILV